PTRAEARQAVARRIEVVYNRRRLHSSLGYVPPSRSASGHRPLHFATAPIRVDWDKTRRRSDQGGRSRPAG
ncbi:hypothetical protein, partial [Candidatus Corynebacterium faecigallinarum]|uniref:hypothetical protein n=1 Tax=Candidatus Corynebacterium faecigallinarum TaxID=2838528 RepID=UPI003FD59CFC